MTDAQSSGLDLSLDLSGSRSARALERALRDAIQAGRLSAGDRLPPSRSLAADLGVARTTVSEVYGQLTAEGWLDSRVGAGTWVAAASPLAKAAPQRHPGPPPPHVTELTAGKVDASLFPRREWLAAARRALDTAPAWELGYGDVRGSLRLREQVANYLRRTRGVAADPAGTVIGPGFGQLLFLACRALAESGARRVAVEAYGADTFRRIVEQAGLALVPLPTDDEGAIVDGSATAGPLTGLGVDAVLLTPAHQFPTGAPLSPRRRRTVVSWAVQRNGLIIEDDYDGEFRYDRRAVGALQPMAPEHTLYLGTASKALAPGVGIAWAVVPGFLLGPLDRARSGLAESRDRINQLTLAAFLESYGYDRHVRRMRREYAGRWRHLEACLAARAPGARIGGPPAGLQATVMLPAGVRDDHVVAQGLARGIAFRALYEYAAEPDAAHPPAVVIGFGASAPARARSDIEAAADAIAAAEREPAARNIR